MAIFGWDGGVFLEPSLAAASGGFLKAESGEPFLGVEDCACNGGMGNFLWFGSGEMEVGDQVFVWFDDVLLDKNGEGGLKLGVCHEWDLDGKIDAGWLMLLVCEGILELVQCHGSVWLLNVLTQSP